jgi:pimeloyl-ACP methyl ester carboxylesterase
VHLELEGLDHRVYFEEAGRGIPLLLQHTAGAHGSQWRHLFEHPRVTDRYRLIAYDLLPRQVAPPDGKQWWAEDTASRASS